VTVRPRSGLGVAALAVLLVVAARALLPHVPAAGRDYHPDEGVWLAAASHAFQKLFLERDLRAESWSDPRFEEFGTRNPMVGKYVFGVALFVQGLIEPGDPVPGYDLRAGFDWQALRETRPPPDWLAAGRRAALWLGAGSVGLLFVLARTLFGSTGVALAAALLLLADPFFARSSRSVMLDVPALFFSLLALCAGARLCAVQARGPWSAALWTLATGLACGLAIATKLNALLVPCVIVLWLLLARPELDLRSGAVATGLLLTAALVFLGTNPFLWESPIRNTLHIVELGQIVAQYEVHPFQELRGPLQRVAALLRVGVSISGPVANAIGHLALGRWLDLPLCAVGLAICLARASGLSLGSGRGRALGSEGWPRQGHTFAVVYFGVVAAGLLWWIPFVWTRWYLPLEPGWALLEAIGLSALLGYARRWLPAARPGVRQGVKGKGTEGGGGSSDQPPPSTR
jgi:hypothetical protein